MSKKSESARITYAAYVLLLVAFVSLGALVAALAYESSLAGAAAVALAATLIASLVGFRTAAAKRAQDAAAAGSQYKLSIWTNTLHPHEVDRYRTTYRGSRGETPTRLLDEARAA
jgi:hypothetical protein